MAKKRNKKKASPVESIMTTEDEKLMNDIFGIEAEPEVVDLSESTAEAVSLSDSDTVFAAVPVEVPVPTYVENVAAAVVEPMLNLMTCTAQELADYKQRQMNGTN